MNQSPVCTLDQPLDLRLSSTVRSTLRRTQLTASQERTPIKQSPPSVPSTDTTQPAITFPRQIICSKPYSVIRQSEISSALYISTGNEDSSTTSSLARVGLLQNALLKPVTPNNSTTSTNNSTLPLNLTCKVASSATTSAIRVPVSTPQQHSNSSSGAVSLSPGEIPRKAEPGNGQRTHVEASWLPVRSAHSGGFECVLGTLYDFDFQAIGYYELFM